MSGRLVVTVEVCGDPVVGVWCPACLLPSAVALVMLIARRPTVWVGCRDCGMTL